MKSISFISIYQKYAGKWVALSPDEKKVVGVGRFAKIALLAAKKKSEKKPILFKVPSLSISWVGNG
ncbi:hypothetical protein COU96_00360 [Candidatus Shapirobacteria bacterium CG10_big_fil_rev_8_21_14_0_10_38_14]|uniref:DUF5678 domain-containing protein n=1 Tax=Candidatus Shapirobacteria bacterium CG10_big_fil_rev_8_21_14_0_10_38_14 TaxID=1974483 RepID=A0A2M8L651_9BACT|nr:MAG: hypothetical protein COU96_00360 [Candidatus Shapirobacteria bacterium CG10_big_fil_rev_8_21_14_0_10_38_14]